MTTSTRILLLITVPALVAAAASIVGMLLLPDLPETLAVHWGVDGTVDRTDGLGSYIAIVAILVPAFSLAVAGFSIAPLRHGASRLYARTVVAISVWFGVFISLSMFLSVQAQRGVTDPLTVQLSGVGRGLVIGVIAATVLAVLAVLLTPRLPLTEGLGGEVASTPLGAGEKVYWSRLARSPRGVIAIPIVVIVGLAVLFTIVGLPIWATLVVDLVLASLMTTLSWRVVVDQRGLTVTGLFGFPRFHVPLESVVAAAAIDVTALGQYGGWGVRFGRTGWGVITRSGSAIEVQRSTGANFVVTVDDAETAAGLLTGLARRG
jgi:hypothetical protein